MTDKTAYSYTFLRYVHDVLTSEFINVGVVIYVPSKGIVRTKLRHTIGRIKGAFPDFDRKAFLLSINSIRKGLQTLEKMERDAGLLSRNSDVSEIVRLALCNDDSSLQWSPTGTGLTTNPEATLEHLFDRYVSRYDAHTQSRRTDEDVWRPVRQKLEERDLAKYLKEKSIRGSVDEIIFKHAWKNGYWHVYESLSFDLADSEGIKTKAREWLGHLSAVVDDEKTEKFKPYFIVGAPTDTNLQEAYRNAIAILERSPNNPHVFEENQIDNLIDHIEDEVRNHNLSTN